MPMRSLNRTTAMALCLSLSLPGPIVAQELPKCEAGAELPCQVGEDLVVTTEAELDAYLESDADADAVEQVEEAVEESEPVETQPVTEDAAAPAEAEKPAGAEVTEEVVVEQPEAEQPAAEEATSVEEAVEQPTEADTEETAQPEAVTEDAPSGTAEVEAAPEATTASESPKTESVAQESAETQAADAASEGEVTLSEQDPGLAAQALDSDTGSAEVEETVVTDEMARSSSEDFATAVGAKPKKEREGLSNFEKALLLGLGAVAVGTLLNNGDEVVANTGDRVVVRRDGDLRVLKDDDVLLRQPGSRVRTETFNDGSTRTTVVRDDGTEVVTIRAPDGRVLRRARVLPDGTQVVLFDDIAEAEPVNVAELPKIRTEALDYTGDEAALQKALADAIARDYGRTFSLRQIREIRAVRELAPEIEINAINFTTGSSVIEPTQARDLAALGSTLNRLIDLNPAEVFLVEGHTDAVGDASYNLALSDRRAETVALALTEYFGVPPENMITQGYGESALKIDSQDAERENRRATVRRITGLLGVNLARN